MCDRRLQHTLMSSSSTLLSNMVNFALGLGDLTHFDIVEVRINEMGDSIIWGCGEMSHNTL